MTPKELSNKSKEDVLTIFKNHNRTCKIAKIRNDFGAKELSGTVRITSDVIEADILKDLVRCGTTWYFNNHILFLADSEVTIE